jgi:hypothetical protein
MPDPDVRAEATNADHMFFRNSDMVIHMVKDVAMTFAMSQDIRGKVIMVLLVPDTKIIRGGGLGCRKFSIVLERAQYDAICRFFNFYIVGCLHMRKRIVIPFVEFNHHSSPDSLIQGF